MDNAKQIVGLKGIFPDLSDEKLARLAKVIRRISRAVVRRAIEDERQSTGISDEVAGLLQLLASRSSEPQEKILKKALTLYMNAIDYVDRGDRLAILAPDDTIVREIVGIGSSKESDALVTH